MYIYGSSVLCVADPEGKGTAENDSGLQFNHLFNNI